MSMIISKRHKHHRVKSHHWTNGVLQTAEKVFSTLEEALEYINVSAPHSAKIYDQNNELVHSHDSASDNSSDYATYG